MHKIVPPPSVIKKEMLAPFGTPSWDYVAMKKENNTGELKRLEELQGRCGVAAQPANTMNATSISLRRVQVLFLGRDEEDDKDKGALSWFAGKVLTATDVEGGIEANIEWEGEYDNNKDKTTIQVLTDDGWRNHCLGEHSWRLA